MVKMLNGMFFISLQNETFIEGADWFWQHDGGTVSMPGVGERPVITTLMPINGNNFNYAMAA